MYPVSDGFAQALRHSHTVAVRLDAYSGARCVASDLPISDGTVSVSSGSGVHRKLDVTIPDPSLWDVLAPVGTELRVSRGIRFPGGAQEMVPLGVFGIDQQSMPVLTGGAIAISSAPDRWARIQRARFETPRVSDTGLSNVAEIVQLVTEVVPSRVENGRVSTSNPLSATTLSAAVVWDRDRDKAITDLATAAGVDVYFGPLGELVIRDVATMGAFPNWRVNTGRDGVLLSGTATRDRTRVFNVVVVVSSKTDGTAPFPPQIVEDTDPTSPTNVTGPYGRAPYFLTTALLGAAADAAAAGRALLAKTRGRFIDVAATGVVNPALEYGDTVSVPGVDGREALYLLDSFSVPLSTAADQSLTLRSLAAVSSDTGTQGDTTTTSS